MGGKVAVVTGGGGGLGQAQCVRLAEEGATVHIWETNAAAGEETLALLGGDGHSTSSVDITDEAAVSAAVAAIEGSDGGVDILVNNAAVFVFKSVEDAAEEDWDYSNNARQTMPPHPPPRSTPAPLPTPDPRPSPALPALKPRVPGLRRC